MSLKLKEEIKSIASQIIEWRRHFHEYAELSFQEYETTAFIVKKLEEFGGIEISRPTKTGVAAKIIGEKPGKTIAFRADIDALPMKEINDLDYVSKNEQAMHSCGHDGHAAILLGIAKLFSTKRHEMAGSLVCIFQHAEELPPGGAIEMVKAGVMEGVEEIYGLHLSSNYPTGYFGVREGVLTSATDRFDITVIGKGGHSSMPECCVDPIVAGSEIITALQTIISRKTKAMEPAVLSVCKVQAGDAYNIIPDKMNITGSVRTFSKELREKMPQWIETITMGITSSCGAEYKFHYDLGYGSVVNDKSLTEDARMVIKDWFGEDKLLEIDMIMPGEDFSAFTDETGCPGCFVEIGTANEEKGTAVAHHNPAYLMDEDGLFYGTCFFAGIAKKKLERKNNG